MSGGSQWLVRINQTVEELEKAKGHVLRNIWMTSLSRPEPAHEVVVRDVRPTVQQWVYEVDLAFFDSAVANQLKLPNGFTVRVLKLPQQPFVHGEVLPFGQPPANP